MAAVDPQTISYIYRRLQTGFCPAVRQVAETGKNVLNLQSAYFKALDSHFLGLQELVKSSADVCEESDKFASELACITTTLQRINREEEKLFPNLASLITAVNKFSEAEKDRLKELSAKYHKDEKALEKLVKRTGDNSGVQEFYSLELKKAKTQHTQRYVYFAKNYLEILRKQSSILKQAGEIAEKQLLELDAADIVKRLDDVVTQNDTVKSSDVDMLIKDEANETLYEQPVPVEANQVPVVTQRTSVKSQKAEDRSRRALNIQGEEQVESRPNTVASRLSSASGLSQSEADNRSLNTNSYEQRQHLPAAAPRKNLTPKIYKPTPILGLVQAEFEEHQREQFTENSDQIIPRASANGDRWKNYGGSSDADKKARDYFDAIPRPGYTPDQNVIYDPVAQKRESKQPFQPSKLPKQPEIAPRNEENRPPPRYVTPEIRPQPAFSVSDYGRTLICTKSYVGQGEHQLSLEAGERTRLVKSGTRGWTLVRSSDSRQGWFPSRFLALS